MCGLCMQLVKRFNALTGRKREGAALDLVKKK